MAKESIGRPPPAIEDLTAAALPIERRVKMILERDAVALKSFRAVEVFELAPDVVERIGAKDILGVYKPTLKRKRVNVGDHPEERPHKTMKTEAVLSSFDDQYIVSRRSSVISDALFKVF